MRAIVVDRPGPDCSLRLGEAPNPQPGPGQVLIKVTAAGVNRADLLQARGQYPPPPGASDLLGLEVSGVIEQVASQSDTAWRVGDQVCALLPGGGYGEYAVAEAAHLLPRPANLPLPDAAALPEAACTVWSNLLEGGFTPASTLLVHGGAGGIGTMAVALAAAMGATVYATAGAPERVAAVERLGAARGIDYKQADFAQVVMEATGGRGVDVILDVVGAKYLEPNLACLAVGGHLMVIGLMGGAKAEVNLAKMLARRQTLAVTNLRNRTAADKAAIVDQVHRDVWPLVESGRLPLAIGTRMPMVEAAQAHELMRRGQVTGKILLTW
ncbi:MAG: NAD(P)H-quinone oxidoreductase [Bifidobacteriaceae bacterium]|jgi:putative PIG3 family NAD(P)H quinone oxidoreductase|nr:NAD(P)H-quinone oxidoreductase [Bifidobacteriaceae bacterium]